MDKPLRQVPAAWRIPAWDFWSGWSHLLKSQMTLAARLRHWAADGLTLDDAKAIFARLSSPEAQARITYAGELLAELARLAADRVQHRRALAAMRDRRAEPDPAEADRVRRMLHDYTRSLNPDPDAGDLSSNPQED